MPAGSCAWTAGELALGDAAREGVDDQDALTQPSSSPDGQARGRAPSPSPGRSRSGRRPGRSAAAERRELVPLAPAAPTTRTSRLGIEVGHQRGVADLGDRLARRSSPRSVATTSAAPRGPASAPAGSRPASPLNACIRTSTRSRTERRTGGRHATSPTRSWSSSRHRLPLARLRPEADLAKRVAPPARRSRRASGRRRGTAQRSGGSRRPRPSRAPRTTGPSGDARRCT